MKRAWRLSGILAAVLLMTVFSVFPAFADEGKKIVILHTNDVHCSVDQKTGSDGTVKNLGYAAVAAYKKAMQSEYGAGQVTLVDAGDHVQGGNIGTLSKGSWIIDIMNKVGYDIAIPGNHEFDYGFQRFLELTKMAKFPYLCSNLTKLSDGKSLFSPYKIVAYGDTKVAFVGIDTPEAFTKSTPVYFQDANGNYLYSFSEDASGQKLYDTVQNAVDAARNAGASYVVAIGHLGENGSTERWRASSVAANTNGIDILIDGHSHEQFEDVLTNKDGKDVIRAQTGTALAAIGKIVIDPSTGEITRELVTDYMEQDPDTLSAIQTIEKTFNAEMGEKIGTAVTTLTTKDPATGKRLVRSGETNLGDLCADAYRTLLGSDIGIMNGGGIRADIAAGNITRGDILNVFPFGNVCCVVKISGQQLLDALEFAARYYPEENGEFLHVSGMSYAIDPSVPTSVKMTDKEEFVSVDGARRVYDAKVNGQPVDVNKDYTVGGINYTLINVGGGFTMFGKNATVVKDGVMPDYECLTKYIQSSFSGSAGNNYGNPYGQGRITIAERANAENLQPAAENEEGKSGEGTSASAYIVQRGDSLWKIASHFYGDGNLWTVIYHANADMVKNPDVLEIGEELLVPAA